MSVISRIRYKHESLFGSQSDSASLHYDSTYKSLYGLSLFQIFVLTSFLKNVKHPEDYVNFQLKHVLWTLYFLKNYPLRITAARTLGISEPTFDKYMWYGIELISDIDNVSIWFLFRTYFLLNPHYFFHQI